jgi:SAM-dependent methyltransferase
MTGNGPPLVAFPIAIAPSQWDAALEELQRQFTVIRLGGPHIGFVAVLETRAANPGYHWGVRGVLARLEIKPGERILEVGTGSGALVRDLARRTGGANPIVGVDFNAYLLDEASALATAEGVASSIAFQAGNAEALPFPDEAFDVVFTCTVLELCDADRAIAEVYRVLKPGGRAAVITRSSDLPPYWELEVPPDLKTTLMLPGGGFSLVTEVGIVDASLYQRFAQVFADSTPCPFWAVMVPISPMQQRIAATRLAPGERETFEQAASRAMDTGNGFLGNPYHAIVRAK